MRVNFIGSLAIDHLDIALKGGGAWDSHALDRQHCGVYRYTREQPGRHPSAGKGGVAAESGSLARVIISRTRRGPGW